MEIRLVSLSFLVILISTQSPCFADHLVELIEKAALALPIESYENDPFALIQTYRVGKGKHNYTNYYWPKGKGSGPAIFKTKRNDIGKEVVILHSGEDRLRVTLLKKTYVVLIKDKDNNKTYWPLYAYARGGDAIEWDVWEPQRMKESKAFALGWDSCSSSIYTPCKPELQVKPRNDPPGYTKDIWGKTKLDLHIASRLSKYDYFVDLEDTSIERKQIGRTLKFLLNHTEVGLSLSQLIKTIDEKPETHPSSIESGEKHGKAGNTARGKYDAEINKYYKDLRTGKSKSDSGQSQPVTQEKWNSLGLPVSAGLPKPSSGSGNAATQGGRSIPSSGQGQGGRGLFDGLFGGGGGNNGGKLRGKYDEEIDNYMKDLKAGKVKGNSGQPVTQEKWQALGLPASAGLPKPAQQQVSPSGGGGDAWASSFGTQGGRSIAANSGENPGAKVARSTAAETKTGVESKKLAASNSVGTSLVEAETGGSSATRDRRLTPSDSKKGRGLFGGLFGGGNNNGGKPRGKYDEEIDNYFKDLKAGKVKGNSGQPVTQDKWTALGLPASAGIARPEPQPQPGQGGGGADWANSFGQTSDQGGRSIGSTRSQEGQASEAGHQGGRGLFGGLFGGGGNAGGKPRGKYDEEIDNYFKDLKAGKVKGNSGQPVTQQKWQALGLPASAGLQRPEPQPQPAQGGGGADWANSFGQNGAGRSIPSGGHAGQANQMEKQGRGLFGGLFGGGGNTNGGKPRGKYDEEIDNYFKDLKAGKVKGNSGQPVTQQKWQALGLPASAGLPRPESSQPTQGGGGAAWANSFGQDSSGGMGRSISKPANPRSQGQGKGGYNDDEASGRQTEYQFHRHHLPTTSEEEIFNYFRAQSERQGSIEMRTSSEEVISNEWENRGLPRIRGYGEHGHTYSGFSGSTWTANWKTFTGSITGKGRIPFSGFKHHPHIHLNGGGYRHRRPGYYYDEPKYTGTVYHQNSEEHGRSYSSTTEAHEQRTNPPNTKGRFDGQESDEVTKGSEERGRFGGQNSDESSTTKSEEDESTERSKNSKSDRPRSEESEENSDDKKSRQKTGKNSPEDHSSEESTTENSNERSGESDERNIYEIERDVITRKPKSEKQSNEKFKDSQEQGSRENLSGKRTRNRHRDSDQSNEKERFGLSLNDISSEESSEEDEACSKEDITDITASFETARIARKRESKESRERQTRPPARHERPVQANNGITITQSSGPIITYHPMVSFPILPNAQHPILSDPHTVAAVEATSRIRFSGRGLQLPSSSQTKTTHDPSGNMQSAIDALHTQNKGPSAAPMGRSAGTLRPKSSGAPSSISVAEQGRSIHEITNFLASHENDLDLFGRPGWKTQDINSLDELKHFSVDHEKDPFAGFGHCPYENLTLERYVASNGTAIENQIKDYLIPLRAQCNQPLVDTLAKLFKDSVLTTETLSDGGKYEFFKILPKWAVLTKPKLTHTEKNELNIAYEFFWFTRTFLWQLDQMKGKLFYTLQDQLKDSYPTTGKEVKKSPHIVFRLYTALFMFDQIFSSIPTHAIALSRNLILTMKTTLMKSLQDYDRLQNCEACDKGQLEILHNDLISLIAFPEFISHLISSDSREHGPKALVQKFTTYLIDNEKDLKESLEDYIL